MCLRFYLLFVYIQCIFIMTLSYLQSFHSSSIPVFCSSGSVLLEMPLVFYMESDDAHQTPPPLLPLLPVGGVWSPAYSLADAMAGFGLAPDTSALYIRPTWVSPLVADQTIRLHCLIHYTQILCFNSLSLSLFSFSVQCLTHTRTRYISHTHHSIGPSQPFHTFNR